MVEVLGAYGKTYPIIHVVVNKTYLHPTKDLEGAPTRGAGETSTLTRTTGREIGLFLGRPTTDIVTGRTTITVEVVIVNRSKHQHHALGFNSSSITLTRRARNPPGSISHMP